MAITLACVRREIGFRERVYPRFIEKGKMKQAEADYQIEESQATAPSVAPIAEAARELLEAVEMDEHNEAIRHGKKGKAWSGDFVRKQKWSAMANLSNLLRAQRCEVCNDTGIEVFGPEPMMQRPCPWCRPTDDGLPHLNRRD